MSQDPSEDTRVTEDKGLSSETIPREPAPCKEDGGQRGGGCLREVIKSSSWGGRRQGRKSFKGKTGPTENGC